MPNFRMIEAQVARSLAKISNDCKAARAEIEALRKQIGELDRPPPRRVEGSAQAKVVA